MSAAIKAPRKAYRQKDLKTFVGLSRSGIKKMIKAGHFPQGVKISPKSRTRVWFEDDLRDWQEQRAKA